MTVDEAIQYLQGIMASTSGRRFDNVRLTPTDAGFVDQHETCAVFDDGRGVRIPTCVIFTLDGQRVKRVEEYFDPSALG